MMNSTYELCVVEEVTFHFEVFAADGTIDDGCPGEPVNQSGRSRSHCAVNDSQSRMILFDVLNSRADKPFAEWITDVKNGAFTIRNHGFDVDSDGVMFFGDQFE